jgi:hypothetical protein
MGMGGVGGVMGGITLEVVLLVEHVEAIEEMELDLSRLCLLTLTDEPLAEGGRKGDLGGLVDGSFASFVLTLNAFLFSVVVVGNGGDEENISRICRYCGDFSSSPSSS